MIRLSVVICAYNPDRGIFQRTLEALKNQDLPMENWELIIVDNASAVPVDSWADISWHPSAKVVSELEPGLINARICGTAQASTDFIATVDDDTFLDPSYLRHALRIFEDYPQMGIFGGRSVGEFEVAPQPWVRTYDRILCIKNLGEQPIISQYTAGTEKHFPENGPFLIAYRKSVFESVFLRHFRSNAISGTLGRKGKSLASGEDNDITMAIFEAGYEVGYFPELLFTHYIPKFRIEKEYIGRLVEASNKSWVLVLSANGIKPWPPIAPWTLGLRKLKAWFAQKAWKSTANYLEWRVSCGKLEGQALIGRN